MKTATLTLPRYSFIDTAPLAARYAVLTRAVLTYLGAGQFGLMLKTTHKVRRLVRVFTRLERHNHLLARKLEMLSDGPWRDRVLKDLGGLRKLRLWAAAQQRNATQVKPRRTDNEDITQPWLYTPERLAESERLKAHARKCLRASVHPKIVRDRVKVDFEGDFRLPPLPRGERAPRQMRVYTQNTIVEYDWNPMPFQDEKGFGPASVWPAEFYAAMKIEAEILAERRGESNALSSVIPDKGEACRSGTQQQRTVPDVRSRLCSPAGFGRDDKNEDSEMIEKDDEPLPLKDVLTDKVYDDIFVPLPEEASLAGS